MGSFRVKGLLVTEACKRYAPIACSGRATRAGHGQLKMVVRRLPCDRNVVRMRLTQTAGRDSGKTHVAPERVNRSHATIAHAAAQTANQLVQHVGGGSFVRHTPLDALRYE